MDPERTPTCRAGPENAVPIVAFTSGKGGCGKTTLAVNFADTVARAGQKVLLIDTDISNRGATGVFTRWTSTPHEKVTFTRLIRGELSVSGAPRGLSEIKEGFFLIPASSPSEEPWAEPGAVRLEELVGTLRRQVLELAARFGISCVVVDCFCGIDPLTTAAACLADDTIIVNEPDIVTFAGSTNLFFHLKRAVEGLGREPRIHFVVNRVRSDQSVAGLSRLYKGNLEAAVNEAILCYLPYHVRLFETFGRHPFATDLLPNSLFVKKLNLLAYLLFKGRFDHLLRPRVRGWSIRKLRSVYRRTVDPTAVNVGQLVLTLTSFPLFAGVWVLAALFLLRTVPLRPLPAWLLQVALFTSGIAIAAFTLVNGFWLAARVNFSAAAFRRRLALMGLGGWRGQLRALVAIPRFITGCFMTVTVVCLAFVLAYWSVFFLDFMLNIDATARIRGADSEGLPRETRRERRIRAALTMPVPLRVGTLDLRGKVISDTDFEALELGALEFAGLSGGARTALKVGRGTELRRCCLPTAATYGSNLADCRIVDCYSELRGLLERWETRSLERLRHELDSLKRPVLPEVREALRRGTPLHAQPLDDIFERLPEGGSGLRLSLKRERWERVVLQATGDPKGARSIFFSDCRFYGCEFILADLTTICFVDCHFHPDAGRPCVLSGPASGPPSLACFGRDDRTLPDGVKVKEQVRVLTREEFVAALLRLDILPAEARDIDQTIRDDDRVVGKLPRIADLAELYILLGRNESDWGKVDGLLERLERGAIQAEDEERVGQARMLRLLLSVVAGRPHEQAIDGWVSWLESSEKKGLKGALGRCWRWELWNATLPRWLLADRHRQESLLEAVQRSALGSMDASTLRERFRAGSQ